MVLLVSIKARFRQQYIERTTTILEKELWEQDAKRMLHCWAIKNWWQNSGLFPAQFLPSVMALWAWCLLPVGKTDRLRQKRHLSMPLKRGLPERKVFIMVRWLLTASCPTISNFFAGDNCPTKGDVCHWISSNHHQTLVLKKDAMDSCPKFSFSLKPVKSSAPPVNSQYVWFVSVVSLFS